MKIKEIYNLAIKKAISADPRGEKGVKAKLERLKKTYEKLDKEEKRDFDKERLSNPYDDTRILYGDPEKDVKKVMVGVDVEDSGMLLADRLNEKGAGIDLVISHHPEGKALASLDKVMGVQADLFHKFGVPINIAEGLLSGRIAEVRRGVSSINHNMPVDAARLLNVPLMCAHTVCDNLVYDFLQKEMDKKKPETVGDVVKALKGIPEYKEAIKTNAGPMIFTGCEENRAGKIACVEITGGTSGAKEMYEKAANAGIGTIISMHMGEEHRKQAEKYNINVVVAGHISSDSVGLNLLMDELEKKGVKIVPMGGFIRVSRNSARGGLSTKQKKTK